MQRGKIVNMEWLKNFALMPAGLPSSSEIEETEAKG